MTPLDLAPSAPTTRDWWTAKDIAKHYSISVRSVYDAISSGRLEIHRFGQGRGGIRVADADRLAWEAACRDRSALQPAGKSLRVEPITTTSPLVAKHFGRQPSKQRTSCGRGFAPNADTRG